MDFINAHEAYEFVMNHPKLVYDKCFEPWIDLTPHMVNSEGQVSDLPKDNIYLEWWIECGPYVDNMMPHHDWDLDCGANTADGAMIKLAKLVYEKYGGYNQ